MRAILSSASASSPESRSLDPIAAETRVSQSSIGAEHNRAMALPRALWKRAPLVLLRHRGVFAAIFAAPQLVAPAAAAAPLLRAGAESEALKTKLAELSPLGAGLTIETGQAPLEGEG